MRAIVAGRVGDKLGRGPAASRVLPGWARSSFLSDMARGCVAGCNPHPGGAQPAALTADASLRSGSAPDVLCNNFVTLSPHESEPGLSRTVARGPGWQA